MEPVFVKMKQGKSSTKQESIIYSEDKKTSQGFVDIKKKTIEQIEELIERQNNLLKNRSFILKLPDKGEKIFSFKTLLEEELKKRHEEYHSTCNLLSNLTLGDSNLEDIEWNKGKLKKSSNKQLDSDDDDDDDDDESEHSVSPLKLISSHSGTASGKKIEVKSSEPVMNSKAFYVKKVCEKYGEVTKIKERFKPNQLKDNDRNKFASSAKMIKQKLGDKWEVTEATPPVPVYNNTVIISLSESLKLQEEQAERLKELEKKNATERLLKNLSIKMGDKLPVNNITEYRTIKKVFDGTADDSEEDEGSDSDGEDRKGVVYFSEETEHLES